MFSSRKNVLQGSFTEDEVDEQHYFSVDDDDDVLAVEEETKDEEHSPIFNVDDDQHQQLKECIVCHSQANSIVADDDGPPLSLHPCCDKSRAHGMCNDCFIGYIKAEMVPEGAFEGIRRHPEHQDILSPGGALPCPLFITGECTCAAMSLTTLFGVLHHDQTASKMYYLAMQRVSFHQFQQQEQQESTLLQREPRERHDDAEEEKTDEEDSTEVAVEEIRVQVMTALERGAVVNCPQCRAPGIKNDACIHMVCHVCSTRWCYCCGRPQNACQEGGRRCDSVSPYLERQPNWGGFGREGETAAQGAKHEFHRQRQAYFVQHVKDSTPPYHWRAFMKTHPQILTNVPTLGRRIKWKELEGSSPIRPPLFGNATEEDLFWAHQYSSRRETTEGDELEAIDTENEQVIQVRPVPIPETTLETWSSVFSSRGGKRWLFLTMILIPLHVVTWTSRFNLMETILAGVTVVLSGLWTFFTTKFITLRFADNCELYPETKMFCFCRDVQLIGRRRRRPRREEEAEDDNNDEIDEVEDDDDNREGPYFSASGRWRHNRQFDVGRSLLWYCMGGVLLGLGILYNIFFCYFAGAMVLTASLLHSTTTTILLNCFALPAFVAGVQPQGDAAQNAYINFASIVWLCHFLIGFGLSVSLYASLTVGSFIILMGVAFTTGTVYSYGTVAASGWTPAAIGEAYSKRKQASFIAVGFAGLVYCLLFFFAFSYNDTLLPIYIGVAIVSLCLFCGCCVERDGEGRRRRGNNNDDDDDDDAGGTEDDDDNSDMNHSDNDSESIAYDELSFVEQDDAVDIELAQRAATTTTSSEQ